MHRHAIITEYHTAQHARPLVALPHFGLMYFKCDNVTAGYHITTWRSCAAVPLLDQIIEKGWDFCIRPMPSGRIAFKTINGHGKVQFCYTVWEYRWNAFMVALKTIQRYVRSTHVLRRIKRHHPDPANIRNIAEFKATSSASLIPSDILGNIISICVENNRRRPPASTPIVRRSETVSFGQLRRIRQA